LKYLILALIIVSVYNAATTTMGKKLHWSLVLYWTLVAMTYFIKASDLQ